MNLYLQIKIIIVFLTSLLLLALFLIIKWNSYSENYSLHQKAEYIRDINMISKPVFFYDFVTSNRNVNPSDLRSKYSLVDSNGDLILGHNKLVPYFSTLGPKSWGHGEVNNLYCSKSDGDFHLFVPGLRVRHKVKIMRFSDQFEKKFKKNIYKIFTSKVLETLISPCNKDGLCGVDMVSSGRAKNNFYFFIEKDLIKKANYKKTPNWIIFVDDKVSFGDLHGCFS